MRMSQVNFMKTRDLTQEKLEGTVLRAMEVGVDQKTRITVRT